MHYVIGGEGPPIAIVHGGMDSWWGWRDVIPALAQSHTVILPAIRGLARSSKPSGGYDIDNIGDDLHRLLTQHLGAERYVLVGHDWGANACYSAAAQHRESVSKLAIFDTILPGTQIMEERLAPKAHGQWLWHFALFSVPDIAEMLIRNNVREYFETFFTNGAAVPDAIGEESREHYVSRFLEAGALAAYAKYYQNYWTHADQCQEHMRRKLTIPVLAYGGDAGCGADTLNCVREVADDVRGGVIPNCGHWVAEESPEFVLTLLQEFLSESGSGDAARGK
jgi:pimeloyl-ACP methyl ester carboxylesterase